MLLFVPGRVAVALALLPRLPGQAVRVSRADAPALGGTWLGRLLRWWNPIMRILLGSRLHWPLSRWFMLLSWTGRRTSRSYTTPVSYVADGRQVHVTTGDRWWRNFLGDGDVRVRFRGRWRTGRAAPVVDLDESRAQHERLFREHPFFRRLAGIPARAGRAPDVAALDRSLRAGRTLVRIELDDEG